MWDAEGANCALQHFWEVHREWIQDTLLERGDNSCGFINDAGSSPAIHRALRTTYKGRLSV